jgi:hypothetical protein
VDRIPSQTVVEGGIVDVLTITQVLVAPDYIEGHDDDLVLFDQVRRNVTATVGQNGYTVHDGLLILSTS